MYRKIVFAVVLALTFALNASAIGPSSNKTGNGETSTADAQANPQNLRPRDVADADETGENEASDADAPANPKKKRRLDLADTAAGTYSGEIISDARSSSQPEAEITVERIAPNTVRVTSGNPRLPTFTTRLTRAMQTIQHTGGDGSLVFLLDLSKQPRHLDLTVDDASWSGDKASAIRTGGSRTWGGEEASAADAPTRLNKARRLDLADTAAGAYFGEIISDARGSSPPEAEITVRRIGPDTVRVTSSNPRLPTFTTRLTRAMQTIQHTGGDGSLVFLLDLSKQPRHLDLTVDDASWSGDKQQNLPQPGDDQ